MLTAVSLLKKYTLLSESYKKKKGIEPSVWNIMKDVLNVPDINGKDWVKNKIPKFENGNIYFVECRLQNRNFQFFIMVGKIIEPNSYVYTTTDGEAIYKRIDSKQLPGMFVPFIPVNELLSKFFAESSSLIPDRELWFYEMNMCGTLTKANLGLYKLKVGGGDISDIRKAIGDFTSEESE
ncbi:Hypothetical protein ORPV_345 [Orpheovirus IHUMI-LCC2]|uniref:Uncharacterized protein n=1 Tax=Orpheovirus IHUMI-LCC2 TaxID=2023057 RepID=A0A2I2L458_9VIRU|nr:Hypothetical protein ORPV_345 [Orpheovirus IHUMI-LCC2]SNW62249.1 Hypothetical protein ORPV_345 [Orpheovirus IHUMI-LCC2]